MKNIIDYWYKSCEFSF